MSELVPNTKDFVRTTSYDKDSSPIPPCIQVAVRVKPLVDEERATDKNCVSILKSNEDDQYESTIRIGRGPKSPVFTFDRVYRGEDDGGDGTTNTTTTEDEEQRVFLELISPLIERSCASGDENSTILLYGEVNSGKSTCLLAAEDGVIPKALARVFRVLSFKHLKEEHENAGFGYGVSLQFLELFHNRDIIDLLSDSAPIGKSWHGNSIFIRNLGSDNPEICGASMEPVSNVQEAMMCVEEGLERRVGDSGRSHMILTILIDQNITEEMQIKSKINFVELAAPQHQKAMLPRSMKFREKCDVNKTLLVLGIVLFRLWQERKNKAFLHQPPAPAQQKSRSTSFVPYRDSKLTSLLKGSLGCEQSRIVLIACISSANREYEKSLDVLRFANRIKNYKPLKPERLEEIDDFDVSFSNVLDSVLNEPPKKVAPSSSRHETKKMMALEKQKATPVSPPRSVRLASPPGVRPLTLPPFSDLLTSTSSSSSSPPPRTTPSPPRVRPAVSPPRARLPPPSSSSSPPRMRLAPQNTRPRRPISRTPPRHPTATINKGVKASTPFRKSKAMVSRQPTTPSRTNKKAAAQKSAATLSNNNKVSNNKKQTITNQKKQPLVDKVPVEKDQDPSEMSDLLDALLDPSERSASKHSKDKEQLSDTLDALLDHDTEILRNADDNEEEEIQFEDAQQQEEGFPGEAEEGTEFSDMLDALLDASQRDSRERDYDGAADAPKEPSDVVDTDSLEDLPEMGGVDDDANETDDKENDDDAAELESLPEYKEEGKEEEVRAAAETAVENVATPTEKASTEPEAEKCVKDHLEKEEAAKPAAESESLPEYKEAAKPDLEQVVPAVPVAEETVENEVATQTEKPSVAPETEQLVEENLVVEEETKPEEQSAATMPAQKTSEELITEQQRQSVAPVEPVVDAETPATASELKESNMEEIAPVIDEEENEVDDLLDDLLGSENSSVEKPIEEEHAPEEKEEIRPVPVVEEALEKPEEPKKSTDETIEDQPVAAVSSVMEPEPIEKVISTPEPEPVQEAVKVEEPKAFEQPVSENDKQPIELIEEADAPVSVATNTAPVIVMDSNDVAESETCISKEANKNQQSEAVAIAPSVEENDSKGKSVSAPEPLPISNTPENQEEGEKSQTDHVKQVEGTVESLEPKGVSIAAAPEAVEAPQLKEEKALIAAEPAVVEKPDEISGVGIEAQQEASAAPEAEESGRQLSKREELARRRAMLKAKRAQNQQKRMKSSTSSESLSDISITSSTLDASIGTFSANNSVSYQSETDLPKIVLEGAKQKTDLAQKEVDPIIEVVEEPKPTVKQILEEKQLPSITAAHSKQPEQIVEVVKEAKPEMKQIQEEKQLPSKTAADIKQPEQIVSTAADTLVNRVEAMGANKNLDSSSDLSNASVPAYGRCGAFHIGDVEDPGLDPDVSRRNMDLTQRALQNALRIRQSDMMAGEKPPLFDIAPLPMNNEDLFRLLRATHLTMNENGDFVVAGGKSGALNLVGLWECRWKDKKGRREVRKRLFESYNYKGQIGAEEVQEARAPEKSKESQTGQIEATQQKSSTPNAAVNQHNAKQVDDPWISNFMARREEQIRLAVLKQEAQEREEAKHTGVYEDGVNDLPPSSAIPPSPVKAPKESVDLKANEDLYAEAPWLRGNVDEPPIPAAKPKEKLKPKQKEQQTEPPKANTTQNSIYDEAPWLAQGNDYETKPKATLKIDTKKPVDTKKPEERKRTNQEILLQHLNPEAAKEAGKNMKKGVGGLLSRLKNRKKGGKYS